MTDAPQDDPFYDDMILQAENIALYIFRQFIEGTMGKDREKAIQKYRRKVYHLAETSRLPVFRLGTTLGARKSALKKFIEDQEKMTARKSRRPDGG